ncbi:CTD kinase subunit alpha [Lachnellula suecica]|uniref:cyclin-dependent kinase n=1 Tax=Lachnellula suecica TaxID=602035 RepID=A0A8T9CA90_9HELO|nr:CTD kinase subunit alpha [Lachnellula suecica]
MSTSDITTTRRSRTPPSLTPFSRYAAMKDSWISGDDRRDRGRVDRGVARQRTRSPAARRHQSDREERDPKGRDRSPGKSRYARDRSHEHKRRASPRRDPVEAVREKNRGRELLLDTRGSDKPKRSTTHPSPSGKRRKSRSPSPPRSHHKKSRRAPSQSPPYPERGSSRPERRHRAPSPLPPRRRSPEYRSLEIRGEGKPKHNRDSGAFDRRGRSASPRSPRHDRPERHDFGRQSSSRRDIDSRRNRSPPQAHYQNPRERSPFNKPKDKERKREQSPNTGRHSPDIDRYEPGNRSRQQSPGAPRGPKVATRGHSPRRDREGRHPPPSSRDEYRSGKPPPKGGKPSLASASGANSIEVKGARPSGTASGANSIEVKSDKMNGRGFYGGPQQGFNPHQQMQAAFPLKQYSQGPVDPRQYSQSPQHQMTPNSYHGSPQAQSPYSAGRGNWGGQQQQYSPPQQYPQNFQQQPNYSTPNGQQNNFYNNQSPTYAPSGPMHQPYQQNFRGNQRAFRGNQFNNRGGRGDYRGRGGSHFQNLHWNSTGAGRGQHNGSGNVTPQHASQHASPQQPYPPQSGSQEGTPQYKAQPEEEEEGDDLFRPSKELQVEDKEATKKNDEKDMPPPSKPTPTGPQSQQNSSKFSFAFKASSKTATIPKPEISQKLSAGPSRKEPPVSPERSRAPSSRNVPTEPASARRPEFREPPPPTTRKVKKIMRRRKEPKVLPEELKNSDSVYYRKPGNESVVGSGTYGKVFKAVHVYTKDLVALKKIRMEGERDGFPVTAVREIKLLQSLKHPNIVNLQEVMVEKNDCFMVFEYLSHDLTGLLNHPSFSLDPAHKKHLAKQLFEGLDYLHRRGVLHRDIKAANILVSKSGQLKIADFGLARFYAKRRQLDYTNRVITIWYRSPELLLGETQYGPAVDMWSAACVLVEIFTRHAIFPGDGGEISQLEKIYAILGTPNKEDWPGLVDMAWFQLLRPSAKRPNIFAEKYKERVTPAAFDLLEAMFQYDPAKRPSASDVLEHPYFTTEDPKPKQVHELSKLDGDWHEFESKALRKENERKDKEARRQAQKDAAAKEKKRAPEGEAADREAKRLQVAK